MQIKNISAYHEDGKEGRQEVNVTVTVEGSLTDAVASVLSMFDKDGGYHVIPASTDAAYRSVLKTGLSATGTAVTPDAPAEKVTRTRRPRTNPDASPATAEAVVETAAPTAEEPRRRTRVTAQPEPETVKTISDADLTKACSNAAAIIGPDLVKLVLADFSVDDVSKLAPDVREKFIGELSDEIRLAQEEAAKAA